MRTIMAFVCLLALTAASVAPVWAWDKQGEPPHRVQGRFSSQEEKPTAGEPVALGTEYNLQDSQVFARVTLRRTSDSDHEISGVLALNDSRDIIRWSSRRLFLHLFNGDAEVAKVYLPSTETALHELSFTKSFSVKKSFNRFEITIIGDVRLTE